jgi:hypothetical protein
VIFVGSRSGTQVYRTPDDVPPVVRRRLKRAISNRQTRTLWIADERGRQELERSAHRMLTPADEPVVSPEPAPSIAVYQPRLAGAPILAMVFLMLSLLLASLWFLLRH